MRFHRAALLQKNLQTIVSTPSMKSMIYKSTSICTIRTVKNRKNPPWYGKNWILLQRVNKPRWKYVFYNEKNFFSTSFSRGSTRIFFIWELKKLIQSSFMVPPLYHDFYKLLYWDFYRFVHLINWLIIHLFLSQQL